jgi:ferritin-like metal-binding protein YciE
MTMTTLDDLLLDQIRDLYDAEKQLVRALPKMAKAATSEELRGAIENHLEETKNQVARLEEIFGELETPAKSKSCKAMKGLIEEGAEAAEENAAEALVDLSVIAAAQRVEHYEISAYGTARAIAEHLRQDRVAELLKETEEEEKAADSKLTEIAAELYGEVENDQQSPAQLKKPSPVSSVSQRRLRRA